METLEVPRNSFAMGRMLTDTKDNERKYKRCSSGVLPHRTTPKIVIERAKSAQYASREDLLQDDRQIRTMAQAGQLVCRLNTVVRDTRGRLRSGETDDLSLSIEDLDYLYFDDSDDECFREGAVF